MRVVQIEHPEHGRRVAMVDEPHLRLLDGVTSVYELSGEPKVSSTALLYDDIYAGMSQWTLLPPIDHPHEPARCLVSGTGLTHLASASGRDAMHSAQQPVTDSMRMYQWGVEGGRKLPGAAPEWFYKGSGRDVRAHLQELTAGRDENCGEEAEIAGVYLINPQGKPVRIGMTQGNEFSDHGLEKRNYLYLAASKLRPCSIGPELVLDPVFDDVRGEAAIEREGTIIWKRALHTGEAAMCHSLANIEHHHFKFAPHCHPGDVHIHFFGASAFSFADAIALHHGDVMSIHFDGFGRALLNRLARL